MRFLVSVNFLIAFHFLDFTYSFFPECDWVAHWEYLYLFLNLCTALAKHSNLSVFATTFNSYPNEIQLLSWFFNMFSDFSNEAWIFHENKLGTVQKVLTFMEVISPFSHCTFKNVFLFIIWKAELLKEADGENQSFISFGSFQSACNSRG